MELSETKIQNPKLNLDYNFNARNERISENNYKKKKIAKIRDKIQSSTPITIKLF